MDPTFQQSIQAPEQTLTFKPDQVWDVLDSHFKNPAVLVDSQILSYDNMINIWLPQLLQQSGFEILSKHKKVCRTHGSGAAGAGASCFSGSVSC